MLQFNVAYEYCEVCGAKMIGDGCTVPRICSRTNIPYALRIIGKDNFCSKELIMYETIEYCGVLLTCEYEYTPEQLETFTDPGYPEELNVTKVIHRNDDITDLLDSQLEEISDEVLKILKVGDPS